MQQHFVPRVRIWAELMTGEEFFETVYRFENPVWSLTRNSLENKFKIFMSDSWKTVVKKMVDSSTATLNSLNIINQNLVAPVSQTDTSPTSLASC